MLFSKNFSLCANINPTDSLTVGLLIYFVCFADLYFASAYFKERNRPTHVMRATGIMAHVVPYHFVF